MLLLAVAACVTVLGPRPPEGLRAAPEARARVESWLARIREEMAQRRSLRAYVKLRVASEQGKGTVRAVIAAERPDRLRLETLNLLGMIQTLLVVDGPSFGFTEGGPIERGTTDPEVLRLRLGLDVDPGEAVALLLAAPTLPEGPVRGVFASDREIVAELPPLGVLRFGMDGSLAGVTSRGPRGDVRWEAEFSNWRELPGGRYPAELKVSFPSTEVRAELIFEDVELNAALDAKLFSIPERRVD